MYIIIFTRRIRNKLYTYIIIGRLLDDMLSDARPREGNTDRLQSAETKMICKPRGAGINLYTYIILCIYYNIYIYAMICIYNVCIYIYYRCIYLW